MARDSLRGFLGATAVFLLIVVTVTSAEPFLLGVRKAGGGILQQMAETADFWWVLALPFGDSTTPLMIAITSLPFLLSSFLSYRTMDRSMHALCLRAVVAFFPGILVFLFMLALSGAMEAASAHRTYHRTY